MDLLAAMKLLLGLYGPLGLGWVAALGACMGMWRMHTNHRKEIMDVHALHRQETQDVQANHRAEMAEMYKEHRQDLARISESVTKALTDSTRATTALTTRVGDWVLRRSQDG